MLSSIIKKKIEEKSGHPIRYPKDCEALSAIISANCNCRLSGSTLKRLYGFVKGIDKPRLFTLDVVANYLDYKSWEELLGSLNNSNDSEFKRIDQLTTRDIDKGQIIEFGYEPKRRLVIKYNGSNTFEVISSENSKLNGRDLLKFSNIVIGYPLFILDVCRENKSLGNYTAGKVSGITYIKKIKT